MSRFLLLLGLALLAPMARADEPLSYKSVSDTDLTGPFHTRSAWRLVITQEPETDDNFGQGDLHFCFIHDGKPECPDIQIPPCLKLDDKPICDKESAGSGTVGAYNGFDKARIFQPQGGSAGPLLVVHASGSWGGPSFPNGPIIWRYQPDSDRFVPVLQAWGSPNTNGEARFVDSGPLAGSVIQDEATGHRPYRYRLTVYRLLPTNHYRQVLSYEGNTKYNDGNRLAVIDSEMPEIERRLNLWKPGDPLPQPERMPVNCTLELRQGIEWCR